MKGVSGGIIFLLPFYLFSQVSVWSELQTLNSFASLPRYQTNTYVAQTSSYDTTGGNDDGFSGKYSLIRRNSDSTIVIFDQKGPGVITRMWTPTPSADTLDFYIDDTETKSFSICYYDLFSGNVFPFILPLCGNQLGGYYSYMPIPYSLSCKIVFRGKRTQFHQIQYKKFTDDRKVKPFSLNLSYEEKQLLDNLKRTWNNASPSFDQQYSIRPKVIRKTIHLSPGLTTNLLSLRQGGRILGIELENPSAFESLQKNIDIKITWDLEKVPAVYCPVSDFFGYAFGNQSMRSVLIGSDAKKCYVYIPMPFDKTADLQLLYRKQDTDDKSISVNAIIYYSEQVRDKHTEGKLYTSWNSRQKEDHGKPHVFLEHKGKGHLVGTVLQSQGLTPGMTIFFEGDDSTVLDNEMRLHGTGSEDYFNGGWYALMDRWDQGMSLPIHGSLDYSLLFCRTGGYRFYLADKLTFNNSIHHSIEHGPQGNSFPSSYTSLAFYYTDKAPVSFLSPSSELTKVYLPDTLYIFPGLMKYTNYGNYSVESYWKYGTGGESYRYKVSNESNIRFSLDEVPDGMYDIYFDMQVEPAGVDFSIWQRQSPVLADATSISSSERREMNYKIGRVVLTPDTKSLTMRLDYKGEEASLLLHRVKLVKVRSF